MSTPAITRALDDLDDLADLLGIDFDPAAMRPAASAPKTVGKATAEERDALGWALYLNGLESDDDPDEAPGLESADEPADEAPEAAPIVTHGKGSQKAARDAGAVYLYQVDPRGAANAFHGFRTASERDAAAAAHIAAGLEVVERCDGGRPARPYIDVDAPADATAEELETIADAFAEVAALWAAPADKLAPIVNTCDRAAKRSRHLIADGWAVPDGLAVQQFAEDVKTRLAGNRFGLRRAAEWVDRSGGRLSYGLRVAGCPKAGDAAATLSGPLTWLQTEGEPVVDPPNAEPTTKPPRDDSPGGETRESHITTPIPLPGFPVEDAEPAGQAEGVSLAQFLTDIAVAFAGVYELDPSAASAGNVVASFDRIAPGYCEACEKTHDRAGAYVSKAPDGSMFMRCRRTPKHGPPLRSKLVKRVATPAAPAAEPDADTFDDLAEFETVGGPGTYNAEAIGGTCAAWDLYAASAWGTGKSQHNAAIVRALLERKPRAVVLVISSRKSLSAQLAHDIGAVAYDRIRGNLDSKATPVSVWQLDSLGRIGPDVVPELVIVDELSQLTAHAWQSGNSGGKAAAGVSSLRALVQRAGRVIISDNDLTAAQVEAFKRLRPGKAARVVRNAFQPWAATSVKVLTGKGAAADVRAKLWEFLDAQHAARAAGLPWEAAAAPCHSLKVARALAEEAAQRYGADAVRLYTSETDDGQKRRDFADAGAAWDPADGSGPLLVVYTSTVSVGVSCPSERFGQCFAFFGAGNCAATQSAQMLFRCRRLRAVLVAYDGKPRDDLPQQPADLFRWVVDARNLAALPDAFRNDRNPFVTTPTASDPEALAEALRGNFEGSLWVANAMEVNRSARWFVPRLRRIIERAGMAVTVEAARDAVDEAAEEATEKAELAADRKRAELMAGEMTRRHVAAVDAAEMGRDPDDDRADKTAGDKAGDRARYIARDLRKDPAELAAHFEALAAAQDDPEGPTAPQMLAQWLAAYEDIAPAYRRACRVVGLGPTLAAAAGALAVRSSLEADELTRETFAALGAEPCAAALTVEPATLLADPVINLAGRINAHASRLFDDRHGAERAEALAGTQSGRRRQAAASSLNTVLAQVGAKLRPEYDTARAKKQGAPSRFRLAWLWAEAPLPRPEHPTKPAGGLGEPRQHAHASLPDAADITTALAAFEHIAPHCAALTFAPQSASSAAADDASELARARVEKALTA